MKTPLAIIGALALLFCGGVGVLIFFGVRSASNVMGEAQAYGDESMRAVCTDWNAGELERRAAKELIEQNPPGTLKSVVDRLTPLGKLKVVESRVTGIEAKTSTDTGTFTIAKYSAVCEFEKGDADAELELLKRDGEWRILKFSVKQK